MPIIVQPSQKQEWVSAYRPISFIFAKDNANPINVEKYQNAIVEIYFDGILYQTIRRPFWQYFAFAIFGYPLYVKTFTADIQRYAQAYLAPIVGNKSSAAPNTKDLLTSTGNNFKHENVKHYCTCYVRVKYEYKDADTGVIVQDETGEQSDTFRIANATLQHYESFVTGGAPTQDLKPFYIGYLNFFKFLTNKKGNIKMKRGTPHTISYISKNVHGVAYTRLDSLGNSIGATHILPVAPISGFDLVNSFHARIGVSDVNINSINNWLQTPAPVVNGSVRFIRVVCIQWYTILGIPIPVPVSEQKTFEFDDCDYSFQLDYMNPLGGFDSYVFSEAEVKSKITKESVYFEKSLSKAGYTESTWKVEDTGANNMNIEQTDVFTVTVNNCTENQLAELKELVRSPEIYMPINGNYLAVITMDETSEAAGYKVFNNSFQFSFRFANRFITQRK